MVSTPERKALSVELYEVTGEAVPESDPIITGALFFSYKLLEAGRVAEQQIQAAGDAAVRSLQDAARQAAQDVSEASRGSAASAGEAIAKMELASRAAAAAVDQMASERAQTLKAIEAHVVKCLKQASRGQHSPTPLRTVPIWYCLVAAVIGAAMAAAWAVGLEQGSVRSDEAAIGRSFAKAVPGMEPKLRQQLIEHLRRNQD